MRKINLNFKAIIFDFDGVILESVIAKHKAFIQLYKDSNKLTKSKIENLQRSEFKLEGEVQRLKEKCNDKKIIDSSNHILSYKQEEYKEIQ